MKILGVFAHPDDETFGPGGSLALWAQKGAEIHVLCATKGESGENYSDKETAKVRAQELKRASQVIGIKEVRFLGFKDGEIGNNDLQTLEKYIVRKIKSFKPDVVITFDLNGISGHLDHIAIASATTQAFKKTEIARKLYYFTVIKEQTDLMGDNYFIHRPEGKTLGQIDEIIDISLVWDKKVKAMKQHQSQIKDVKRILAILDQLPKKEYFLIRNK